MYIHPVGQEEEGFFVLCFLFEFLVHGPADGAQGVGFEEEFPFYPKEDLENEFFVAD